MRSEPAKTAVGCALLTLIFLIPLRAQVAGSTLTGAVMGASNNPVPNATVTAKDLATGRSQQARTNAAGVYTLGNLAPGEYEVSASAVALNPQTNRVTLRAGSLQRMNFSLTAALSLESLGFSQTQTRGSIEEQALLNKRSHMLQIHQKLGLITVAPLVATVITSFGAHGRHNSPTSRDIHIGLGSATAGLYFATAYYAIFAPGVHGVKTRGPIRFHKAMAWIHGPGMILTPVLGAMAESQMNHGEKLHGAAKYHGDVALVTAVAYGLALLSVTKPHLFADMSHDAGAIFGFHHRAAVNAGVDHPKGDNRVAAGNAGRTSDPSSQ